MVAQKKPSLFGAFFKKVEQVAQEEEEVEEEEVRACCGLLLVRVVEAGRLCRLA